MILSQTDLSEVIKKKTYIFTRADVNVAANKIR